jgi:hypothetical protein
MYGIVLLVIVALVSLLITRVATVALTVTGMARESARFQARSALSGAGFTTVEAEQVVNHPVRRRIVMTLMLLGNIGLATAVAGMLGTFLNSEPETGLLRAAVLLAALAGVYLASKSPVVDRRLSRLIGRWLTRHTELNVGDYERLLHLAGEYAVQELAIGADHWLVGRTLGDVRLRDEGILVLGITRRTGEYVGIPGKTTTVFAGDVLIAYGRGSSIERLERRPPGEAGDRDHAGARHVQSKVAAYEQTDGAPQPDE